MIVKMWKLLLMCTQSSREETLERLRTAGVVDITHVRMPQGEDLDQARSTLAYVERALDVLPKHSDVLRSGEEAEKVVAAVWKIIHENKDLEDRKLLLESEIRRIEPFGDFDPSRVRALAERDIHIRFFQAGPEHHCAIPEGCVCIEYARDRNGVFFVTIDRGAYEIDAHELRLPEASLTDMREEVLDIEKTMERNRKRLRWYAGDRAAVEGLVQNARDRVWYLEVKNGMGATEPVAYLQGFFPKEEEDRLRDMAAEQGWGIVIEEPAADDHPPTLVRNPKWVNPIRPVFQFIGIVPGYEEVDISALFLVFLSIFFAMLVGDAGYGLLFLALTAVLRFGMKKIPRNMAALLTVMSVCTIVWGVLTGTYFGITKTFLPAPLREFSLGWLAADGEQTNRNIMLMCFVIGAVHLTIAHAWNAIRAINSLQALAQVGWICTTWTMFFLARKMVLGHAFPPVMWMVLGIGGGLILLFMTPFRRMAREWYNFVTFPLDLVSNFVDVVSYVRLFAVGAASFAVANAFNQMAGDLWGGVLGSIGAVLIVFAGHVLNIMLAAMGVMVHGIRLNTLEFSSHLGMQWTGRTFNPFRRTAEDGKQELIS